MEEEDSKRKDLHQTAKCVSSGPLLLRTLSLQRRFPADKPDGEHKSRFKFYRTEKQKIRKSSKEEQKENKQKIKKSATNLFYIVKKNKTD